MTSEEQHKILVEWNQTQSDYPYHKTLAQIFEEQVAAHPDQVALIYNNQTLTYQQLNVRANQLGHYLRELGISNNKIVAVCMEPSFDLIIAIVGIIKAGGAYLPLDPNNPFERQQILLEDTKTEVLITQSALTNHFKKNHLHLIFLDEIKPKIDSYLMANLSHINDQNNLAYIIYTSGSTGKPKGVMITHRNTNNFIHWFSRALAITLDDIFDFSSSISFDFSVACSLFPIMAGSKIAICSEKSKKDPYLYLHHLQQTGVTILKITPSHFRQFKETVLSEEISLAFKYIIFGGEQLFVNDLQDWLENFPQQVMFCEYGPTEATVATSWIKVNQNNILQFTTSIPIGKPALNTQLYILDKERQPITIGELGELYIGGDGIATGYLNRAAATQQAFISAPWDSKLTLYKTGDLCRYLPDGNVEFVQRIDQQIKIRGFRIELGEIENCLAAYNDIKESVVLAQNNPENPTEDKYLIAYCVPKNNTILNFQALRVFLREKLPDYMVPTFFVSLSSFPRAASGKLDRKKLPIPENTFDLEEVSPHTELESTLKNIWLEILKLKHVGITDNFFDRGGNSLSAARMITKIRKIIKKVITLQNIYDSPTISGIADIIKHAPDTIDIHTNITTSAEIFKNEIPLNELQFLFWLMKLFYPKSKISNLVRRKKIGGKIDIDALNFAFNAVCKKHPILCSQIAKFYPIQYLKHNKKMELIKDDLRHLSEPDKEIKLCNSLNELENFFWKKTDPSIIVKLYYLEDNLSEIQIAMSHFISDEVSMKILFDDLSRYYLDHINNFTLNIVPNKIQYPDYIMQEMHETERNLNQNVIFWEKYLQSASLLTLPIKYINNVTNGSSTNYFPIPEKNLNQLQGFCHSNHLSITDGLCAGVATALTGYIKNNNKIVVLNIVKSTRDHDAYYKTIGLFVRSDLIKLNLNESPTFLDLAKQTQSAIAESAPFQSCPIILKLHCLLKNNFQQKNTVRLLIKFIAKISFMLFYKAKLNQVILSMFGAVYVSKRKNNFFVDINIMNNFINSEADHASFGFPIYKTKPYRQDKLVADDVINVWFDRDEKNQPYLIISGNLTTSFRHQLGDTIIAAFSQQQ